VKGKNATAINAVAAGLAGEEEKRDREDTNFEDER